MAKTCINLVYGPLKDWNGKATEEVKEGKKSWRRRVAVVSVEKDLRSRCRWRQRVGREGSQFLGREAGGRNEKVWIIWRWWLAIGIGRGWELESNSVIRNFEFGIFWKNNSKIFDLFRFRFRNFRFWFEIGMNSEFKNLPNWPKFICHSQKSKSEWIWNSEFRIHSDFAEFICQQKEKGFICQQNGGITSTMFQEFMFHISQTKNNKTQLAKQTTNELKTRKHSKSSVIKKKKADHDKGLAIMLKVRNTPKSKTRSITPQRGGGRKIKKRKRKKRTCSFVS